MRWISLRWMANLTELKSERTPIVVATDHHLAELELKKLNNEPRFASTSRGTPTN
jgi:hypothetical protein